MKKKILLFILTCIFLMHNCDAWKPLDSVGYPVWHQMSQKMNLRPPYNDYVGSKIWFLFLSCRKRNNYYFNFYFKNLENVFIRFCFFKNKFINHLVVIHFRFSFKKLLYAREFLEFVASSSRNTENILTDKFLPNYFLGQRKMSHFKMAENLPETAVESNIGQSHVISN